MRGLTGLQHRFGFTRNETGVILFLTASLVAGAGIRALIGPPSAAPDVPVAFDYAPLDSAFTALSAAPARPFHRTVQARKTVPSSPIDINAADTAALERLPGVGPAFARRIVEYRERHGRFARADDLLHVSGIGRRRLESLRPYISVH